MKVLRLAIITGAICGVSVMILFGYEIIINENTGALERLGELANPPFLGIVGISILVFAFISNLILFPYYLFNSIPFFMLTNWQTFDGRNRLKENINSLYGLLTTSIITVSLVVIGSFLK